MKSSAFWPRTLIAPIVRAYVRRNLNYGVSERKNVCVGGEQRNEKRREEKEKKRKEMQRGAWLFIGCARFRSLPSKGSLSFLLAIDATAQVKKKKKNGKKKGVPWVIFIIPCHYSFDTPCSK